MGLALIGQSSSYRLSTREVFNVSANLMHRKVKMSNSLYFGLGSYPQSSFSICYSTPQVDLLLLQPYAPDFVVAFLWTL